MHYAADAKRLGLVDEIVRDFEHAIQRIRADAKRNTTEGGGSGGRAASSDQDKEKTMSEQQKPTRYESAEQLAKEQPELAAALREQGAVNERNRIAAIQSMAEASQADVVSACVAEGVDENEARKRLHEDLRKQKTTRIDDIAANRREIGTPDGDSDIETEFTDEPAISSDASSFEAKAFKDWNANKDGCKARFGGQFALYLSHLENERAVEEGRGKRRGN